MLEWYQVKCKHDKCSVNMGFSLAPSTIVVNIQKYKSCFSVVLGPGDASTSCCKHSCFPQINNNNFIL